MQGVISMYNAIIEPSPADDNQTENTFTPTTICW